MVKAFLILYFAFSSVADPWIDGFSALTEIHENQEYSHNVDHSSQKDILNIAISHHGNHGHGPSECPESCPEHTCHLGHCGFLVTSYQMPNTPKISFSFGEYKQFLPSPHIYGLKRPPKFQA